MNKVFVPLPSETDEAAKLRNSRAYRVGSAVVWLPEKVIRAVRAAGGKRK